MHTAILTTDRLILKSVTPALIHELFKTKDKEYIQHFLGASDPAYERYRDMHERGMETHRLSLFFFLVVPKGSDVPAGECGFHTWNRTHNRAEVFYMLNNDADKRKGYMTEALQAVLDFGFSQLGLHRVEAFVAPGNTPSVKLLSRYGFTKEGTAREHYNVNGKNEDSDSYSLLKHEFSHKPKP
jgi:[ribosomal protein S5]-alanine N-acetyltransferase